MFHPFPFELRDALSLRSFRFLTAPFDFGLPFHFLAN